MFSWGRNLLKIALVVGIPAIGAFFFYKRLAVFYVHDSVLQMKLAYLYGSGGAVDYLFMGSSRTVHHIDPHVIDSLCGSKSYNLGFDGCRIAEMQMLLKVCIERHKLPRFLVINIDASSFTVSHRIWSFVDILPYAESDTVVYNAMSEVQGIYRAKWKYPFYRLQYLMSVNDGYKLSSFWKKEGALARTAADLPDTGCRADGFQPEYSAFEETYVDPFNEEYAEEGFDLLKKMIGVCQSRGVGVVLYTAPMYKDYRRVFLNMDFLLGRVSRIADSLRVPYYNMIDDSCCLAKQDYYNLVHLNGWGAEKFSARLARALCEADTINHWKKAY